MTYQEECSRKASLEYGSSYAHARHMHWHAFDLYGSNPSTRTSTASAGSRYARYGYVAPSHPYCRGHLPCIHPTYTRLLDRRSDRCNRPLGCFRPAQHQRGAASSGSRRRCRRRWRLLERAEEGFHLEERTWGCGGPRKPPLCDGALMGAYWKLTAIERGSRA